MSSEYPVPLIILLAHAYYEDEFGHDEMVSWADQLGVDRFELSSVFGSEDHVKRHFRRRATQRSSLSATPQPKSVLRRALAIAYAHGQIELDVLLCWAEEAGLTRVEAGEAIRLAAELAYGASRQVPYGMGEAA
jgi:hypothetical protein